MTVFVTIQSEDGLIREVTTYLRRESAEAAETAWLTCAEICSESDRERAADFGTRFLIQECALEL